MISVNEKTKASLNYCLVRTWVDVRYLWDDILNLWFRINYRVFTWRIILKAEFLITTYTVKTPSFTMWTVVMNLSVFVSVSLWPSHLLCCLFVVLFWRSDHHLGGWLLEIHGFSFLAEIEEGSWLFTPSCYIPLVLCLSGEATLFKWVFFFKIANMFLLTRNI